MKFKLPQVLLAVFLFISTATLAQLTPLTVEKIMRDPKWIGVAPSNVTWSEDSKNIYFNWNPDKNAGDSLYSISLTNRVPSKVSPSVRRGLTPANGTYNKTHTKKLFEKNGDVFLHDLATSKVIQITNTNDREFNALFSLDERKVVFTSNSNLYSWEITTGSFTQLTDFKRGSKRPDAKASEQEKWLKADQLAYIEILKQRKMQKQIDLNVLKKFILTKKILTRYNLAPMESLLLIGLPKTPMQKVQLFPTM
jgi:hypothetical protein